MKKITLGLIAIAISLTSLKTNAQAFQEGNNIISVGYGIATTGRTLLNSYKSADPSANIKVLGHNPIYGKFEHAISDKWGLGINFFATSIGISQTYTYETIDGNGNSTTNTYKDEITYKVNAVSVRFNRHWEVTDDFDVYFGFGGGPKWGKFESKSTNPDYISTEFNAPIPFAMELTMGARYYFTQNIGLYTEIGMARSFMQAGLSIKF